MITAWDLNPIVLSHTNRFFQAATVVLQTWSEPDEDLLGALLTLSGNMLWARSSFEARSKHEEQGMAYSGAFISSVADRAAQGLLGGVGQALDALTALERQVRCGHDAILAALAREFAHEALEQVSPAGLNDAVWERLFPEFAPDLSQGELCAAIRARLARAAAA